MRTIQRSLASSAVILLSLCGLASAATPPGLLNYEGALRDNLDVPQTGTFDMVFRFYDADGGATCVGGTLLLCFRFCFCHAGTMGRARCGFEMGSPDTYVSLEQCHLCQLRLWQRMHVKIAIFLNRIVFYSSPVSRSTNLGARFSSRHNNLCGRLMLPIGQRRLATD